MKPLRILLFFIAVFGLLFIISIVFPTDGIELGEDMHLQFFNTSDLFSKDSSSNNYTDSIILQSEVTEDPEAGEVDSTFFIADIIAEPQKLVNIDSVIRARIDSISKKVYPIEFAGNSKAKLYKFFAYADHSKKDNQLIRILHFGDSQIENDRMSSLLRYRFQKIFGGSGCGLVPAIPLYFGNPTYKEEYEGDWIRYTAFGKRDSTLDHNCFGLLSCYTSIPVPKKAGFPQLSFNFIKGRKASRFNSLKFFLHANNEGAAITLHVNDTISDTIKNIPAGYNVLTYQPQIETSYIQIGFDFNEGGRVYGISFDPDEGLQLDNIAMRGSSGLEFSKSDLQTLDTMLQDLNPGLLIMQFGGNVVPYITNCSFYKKVFKRELSFLKKLLPEIPILVIGPADMSTRVNGKFVTFPKLVPVRNALKEAALESGCAFWDMYEAMGGRNSMQNFVMAVPPLASSDYIHFTQKGANMMAGMFFDAVMLEYGKYRTGKQ